ncbi:hypothetical protein OFM93_30075, partial [Escherichia coli]|nr:hypothetical protein [Escherichia coli]
TLMPMAMKHPWQLMVAVVIGHALSILILGNTVCTPTPVSMLYIVLTGHPQPERRVARQRRHQHTLLRQA